MSRRQIEAEKNIEDAIWAALHKEFPEWDGRDAPIDMVFKVASFVEKLVKSFMSHKEIQS